MVLPHNPPTLAPPAFSLPSLSGIAAKQSPLMRTVLDVFSEAFSFSVSDSAPASPLPDEKKKHSSRSFYERQHVIADRYSQAVTMNRLETFSLREHETTYAIRTGTGLETPYFLAVTPHAESDVPLAALPLRLSSSNG